jgi:phage terminase small subunit
MPNRHGGARPGAGRPKGSLNLATREANEAAAALPVCDDPLQWLQTLMADSRQDARLRVDAAKALLPFMHAKAGEGGKKDEANKAAKRASKASLHPPSHRSRSFDDSPSELETPRSAIPPIDS